MIIKILFFKILKNSNSQKLLLFSKGLQNTLLRNGQQSRVFFCLTDGVCFENQSKDHKR
jgi:hypothetical protein